MEHKRVWVDVLFESHYYKMIKINLHWKAVFHMNSEVQTLKFRFWTKLSYKQNNQWNYWILSVHSSSQKLICITTVRICFFYAKDSMTTLLVDKIRLNCIYWKQFRKFKLILSGLSCLSCFRCLVLSVLLYKTFQ